MPSKRIKQTAIVIAVGDDEVFETSRVKVGKRFTLLKRTTCQWVSFLYQTLILIIGVLSDSFTFTAPFTFLVEARTKNHQMILSLLLWNRLMIATDCPKKKRYCKTTENKINEFSRMSLDIQTTCPKMGHVKEDGWRQSPLLLT